MIKDVMVWLDGGISDEIRLSAAAEISRRLESRVVIGMYFNVLPVPPAIEGAEFAVDLIGRARAAGDEAEASLTKRLQLLERPVEIRRFDVLADDIANVAAREARCADTFIGVRPNGSMDPDDLIEGVLFGSGHHLFLVPETERPPIKFDRILVAWNGSREAARALSESMPYLRLAEEIAIVVVTNDRPSEEEAVMGVDAVNYLKHHDIDAGLHRIQEHSGEVGARLIQQAKERKSDLVVMGGYGHMRLRERLFGGVTYNLLHDSPVPVLIAH
jgi:nucleotide-binding universal stress UspA family protein